MILGSGLLQASGKTRLTLYTTKSGTFNPTIVASDTSGIVWDFGDGSATYTGGAPSHSYADGTLKTVTITFSDPTLVTELNFFSQSMTGAWPLSSLADFTALTHLNAYSNASLNVSGGFADLPTGLTNLHLGSTSSVVTDSLANLPLMIAYMRLDGTGSVITGSLADSPSELTYLYLQNTNSNISGGPGAMAATGIRQIRVDTSSTSQANIDDILLRLYTDRASFIYATPLVNVGGANPNPTGTYQDATPPTTGLEYAYKLVNDPDTEGFKKWAVAY